MILALDQSFTCSGIVIMNSDGDIVYSGNFKTSKQSDDIYEDFSIRAEKLVNHLMELTLVYPTTHLVCEAPSMASFGNASRSLSWLFGALKFAFPYMTVVQPTKLKKYATGYGKATKKDMLQAVISKNPDFGAELNKVTITNGKYDIADAFHLAHFKREELCLCQ